MRRPSNDPRAIANMLTYYPVSPRLARACAFLYRFRPGAGAMRLPALLPQLQIHLAGHLDYAAAGQTRVRSGVATLVGATNSFLDIETGAETDVLGIGFLPAGWRAIVGMPADLAADAVLDATALWPASMLLELRERIAAAAPLQAAALLDSFAWQQFQLGGEADPRVDLVDSWISQVGRVSVDDLRERADLSFRQVERLTRASHGAPPRLLELKYRTLKLATELALTGDTRVGDMAAAELFYDQSHIIRSFKRFVGATPRAFEAEGRFLARQLLIGRWQAGTRSPLALWS